jgi:hypothetical protein
MNPVFDTQAHKELRSIYIIPESAPNNNEGIQSQSIYWVKSSPSGLVTATNQNSEGSNENISGNVELSTSEGYGLTGVVNLHYNWRATTATTSTQEIIHSQSLAVSSASSFPYKGWIRFLDTSGLYRYARFVNKTDTTLILSPNQSEVAYKSSGLFVNSGTTIELVNFVDERTTLSTRTTDESNHVPTNTIPVSYSRYFILAEMSVNSSHGRQDSVHIDVRENGGGVKTEKYEEAKLLNPKVQWLSDFVNYDGQPYPGDAVVIIKLPISLLDTYSEEQLYSIVEKNIPVGVKPIVRYYGYQPNVTYVGRPD